ncbi:MAG: glycosyltransferase [Deltaproteobacteria bacterium]
MRILYYTKEENNYMWQWQRFHIFDELAYHNCFFDILNPLYFSSWDQANDKLLETLKKSHYDLLMTTYGDGRIYISTLKEIKKIGVPSLLFCPDNNTIPFHYKNVCSYFDLVWLTSVDTEYLFKNWRANTIFMPFAANPYMVSPTFGDEIEKVCFIGTPYGTRQNMFNTLLDGSIDFCLYSKITENTKQIKNIGEANANTKIKGAGTIDYLKFHVGRKVLLGKIVNQLFFNKSLKNNSPTLEIHDPLPFDTIYQIYSRFALSISSVTARNTGVLKKPVYFVYLRCFEIPMSGGLQICHYCQEFSKYFEEDKEIIFYRSDKELVDKARFYLRPENHSLRLSMKQAARRRSENEHTWHHRFEKIFKELSIKQ